MELAEKFFTLKSSLSEGTKTDYLATAKEFDHVNKQVYGEEFSTDEIAEWVIPAQNKLLELLKFEE